MEKTKSLKSLKFEYLMNSNQKSFSPTNSPFGATTPPSMSFIMLSPSTMVTFDLDDNDSPVLTLQNSAVLLTVHRLMKLQNCLVAPLFVEMHVYRYYDIVVVFNCFNCYSSDDTNLLFKNIFVFVCFCRSSSLYM